MGNIDMNGNYWPPLYYILFLSLLSQGYLSISPRFVAFVYVIKKNFVIKAMDLELNINDAFNLTLSTSVFVRKYMCMLPRDFEKRNFYVNACLFELFEAGFNFFQEYIKAYIAQNKKTCNFKNKISEWTFLQLCMSFVKVKKLLLLAQNFPNVNKFN